MQIKTTCPLWPRRDRDRDRPAGQRPRHARCPRSLFHPTHASFDAMGRFVLAAWHNDKIMRLDPTTGFIRAICGSSNYAFSGAGGPAGQVDINLAFGLAAPPGGHISIHASTSGTTCTSRTLSTTGSAWSTGNRDRLVGRRSTPAGHRGLQSPPGRRMRGYRCVLVCPRDVHVEE